ncbi:hypothetical protein V7200_03550 [Cytobacillus firmus]|uniref:Phage related protein n=2 Tax=Cytobacillus firmus TaxID=1399 RepID=A0A800MUH2_CYTFI|nr:hypothetical protein [Cytobacillus firmus]KAF0822510.1 phage related protein [Cytobacillus firmus]
MQIKLFLNDEEKTFTVPFIKGRMLREALKMNKSLGEKAELDDETLDDLVHFVCGVFNNQFTPDDVFDGLPIDGIFIKLQGVLTDVINKALSGLQGESNGESNPKNV